MSNGTGTQISGSGSAI